MRNWLKGEGGLSLREGVAELDYDFHEFEQGRQSDSQDAAALVVAGEAAARKGLVDEVLFLVAEQDDAVDGVRWAVLTRWVLGRRCSPGAIE